MKKMLRTCIIMSFQYVAVGYILIVDPPITPYSSVDSIKVWIKECEEELAKNPDNEQWLDALSDARRILALKWSRTQEE